MNAAIPAAADTDTVRIDDRAVPAMPPGLVTIRALAGAASGSFGLNIVNTAATVLATAVLARIMDLAAFGIYSWVVATIYLLTLPAVLGIDRLVIRDVAVYVGRGAFGHVRGLLLRSAQLMAVSCTVIAAGVLLAMWLGGSLGSPTAIALAIGLVSLPLLTFGRLAQSALVGVHRIVVGQVPDLLVRPLAMLVIVALVVVAGRAHLDAPTAVMLYTLSTAAGLAAAAYFMRARLALAVKTARPEFESRRWVATAFALALLSGGAVANGQIGVTLLGLLDKPEAAGLYAVAQRGALTVAFPLLGLGAALAPTAARLWSTGHVVELQRLITLGTRGVLLAALPIAFICVVFGGQVLDLVFGASFVAAASALAVLSLAQLFNTATGSVQTLLIMTGKTHLAGVGIALGFLANVVLAVLLIPGYHVMGAAVAAASSIIVTNLIHVLIARHYMGIDTTPIGSALKRA